MGGDFSKDSRPFRLGIRGRLTLWFAMGAVAALALGIIVFYVSGLTSIQGTLGQTYCQIASRTVSEFENHFTQERTIIRDLATDVLTSEVVMEAVQDFFDTPEVVINARWGRQAAEWSKASKAEKRNKILHPQLSDRLSILSELHGAAIRRLLVYDSHGTVLAANSPPALRSAREQPWFKAVSNQQRHFSYVDIEQDSGWMIFVIPVWGGIEIIGYVVAKYDFSTFAEKVRGVRFGDTGEALLTDSSGLPFFGKPKKFLTQALKKSGKEKAKAAKKAKANLVASKPHWVALKGESNWPLWNRLVCVAPLPLINSIRTLFGDPPWSLVVTQSPEESYAALLNPLGSFTLLGVFGVFLAGLGAALLAWRITAPLKELQAGVQRFAVGERAALVEVSSSDEIGELANEFNRMAERVILSENELRAFAEAVEEAADAIIMTDATGIIYYTNPAFEKVTGYSADEAKGETPAILQAPETPLLIHEEMWNSITTGCDWRGELLNMRKNGEVYPVDLTISPIHDERGEVVSLLGILRDITLAREYQESLEREVAARTREIAETHGLAVMGQMASMIAHDLRNALSTVKMNLQILRRKHRKAAGTEFEHCQTGLDQISYMEEILRDMLSYARPERLRSDWHDVIQIINEALVAESSKTEDVGVKVWREDSKGLPKVYCDRVKVLEVLRNLIDNASQAMPDGGDLTIATYLVIDAQEPQVQITVQDTGEGIAEDVLPDVFEPFFTTRTKGTGLGLAIIKRIIDQHGGQINIDTKKGFGTSITFTLPTTSASS